jgi:hypothetical protein
MLRAPNWYQKPSKKNMYKKWYIHSSIKEFISSLQLEGSEPYPFRTMKLLDKGQHLIDVLINIKF